jgi:hypothetical protein
MSLLFFFPFSSKKLENRKVEHILPRERGHWYSEGGGLWKGFRRVNIVQILCTHI